MSVSVQKRVLMPTASGKSSPSVGRKMQSGLYRRVPMPKSFRITSTDLHYAPGPECWYFHTTAVELQRRRSLSNAEGEISRELRVMLQCRHPNIIFALGVSFQFPGGPVLVLERTWGSVSKALDLLQQCASLIRSMPRSIIFVSCRCAMAPSG